MELRGVRHSGLARTLIAFNVVALAALLALTLLRLAVAAVVPLVPDETYYWVWSHALAPGYPDHPPMVALCIRLGTWLAGDGPFGIRLIGPIAVAVASWLLADAAECLLPGRQAGIGAAALLNATLLLGVGAILMTPDVPLLVFWVACVWATARLLRSGNAWWWPVIGLLAGLAMASKYTAALLWLGIGAWLLITPSQRFWLRRPAPWLSALLGFAVFAPVLWWNATHEWSSFERQGGRLDTWHAGAGTRYLLELIGGQFGLVTPLIFVFCIGGICLAVRQAWRSRDPAWTLLASLTVPSVVLFVEHSFGDRVQGNWPAIIYPGAVIAAAGLQGRFWRRLFGPAIALGFTITLLAYAQASFALLPVPVRLDPTALQLDGWDSLAAQVEVVRQRTGATFVAADQYGVAAELAHTMPPGVSVVGVASRWDLFNLPPASLVGKTGILVRSTRRGEQFDASPWSNVADIGSVERKRGSETIEEFRLYRVTGTTAPATLVQLPRQ